MASLHFTPFPLLRTPRFVLRALSPEDSPHIFVLRTDDAVNQYLGRPKAKTMADVHQFIDRIRDGVEKDASILWAIEFNNADGFAGTICLWNISWEDARAEIGYELLPQHHGKRIMQEVMPVVLDYAFTVMGLRVIVAELAAENVRSVSLLEKFGFMRDPAFAGDDGLVCYSLEI
jgi:[ribosomal protein S5]-alanine N-acetyltransferase